MQERMVSDVEMQREVGAGVMLLSPPRDPSKKLDIMSIEYKK